MLRIFVGAPPRFLNLHSELSTPEINMEYYYIVGRVATDLLQSEV